MSAQPVMSIGQVVKVLSREFPATTVSKVRFLEDKGLVAPARSASGYRRYSQSDVERIRFVLARQRDSFAPLKVIGEELQALDAGLEGDVVPKARLVADNGITVSMPDSRTLSAREVCELSGCSSSELETFAGLNLVQPGLSGQFQPSAVRIARLLSSLVSAGVPARMLRSIRNGAERNADLVDQIVSSSSRRDRAGDKERARARVEELAELTEALHHAFFQVAIEAAQD